jgi:FMN phosphatase YigB (HAD superfamily)
MVRAVFFDVANTLLYKPEFFPIVANVLNKYRHHIDLTELEIRHKLLSEFYTFPDKTSREFYLGFNTDFLLSLGISPTPELLDDLFSACSYLPWNAFSDTAFLSEIAIPIGVFSNWDTSLSQKLKEHFDVEFQWIFGSANTGIRKPSLAFFEQSFSKTGIAPEEMLYVGDSLKLDVIPASSLGIKSVLIDRSGIYSNASCERISNMYELINFL